MSIVSITKALEKKLLQLTPSITTVFDATSSKPQADQPYQTVNVIPDAPLNTTLGDSYYREEGMLRIRLFYPDRSGKGAILQRAENIRDLFYRGLSLEQDSVIVIIQRTPRISGVSTIGDRLVLAIDIMYFASILK